jgi:hypothetical protein
LLLLLFSLTDESIDVTLPGNSGDGSGITRGWWWYEFIAAGAAVATTVVAVAIVAVVVVAVVA